MDDELKPCPFCGSTELKMREGYLQDRSIAYSVVCMNCASMGAWCAESKENAIASWNRRPPIPLTNKQMKNIYSRLYDKLNVMPHTPDGIQDAIRFIYKEFET